MTDSLGQILRAARDARGETLDDVSRVTHIRARQLSALEADNYAAMPSPAQARGYVKNYAQYLELDLQDILGQYEAEQKKPAHILAVRPSASSRAAAADGEQPRPARPAGTATKVVRGGSQPGIKPRGAQGRSARAVKVRRPRLLSKDLLVAAIVTVVLVGLLLWGGKQLAASLSARATTATQPFVAGLTTVQPLPTATPAPEATATQNLPTPAASYTGVNLSVRAEQRSWVSVKVDGAETFAGLMAPGETREFVGEGVVEVVTGNGLGTRVIWNGIDQGLMGELGEVVDMLWTLQGPVAPTPTSTGTPVP